MEGGARRTFNKASSRGKVGERGHHHKNTMRQNQIGGGLLEKEQSENIEWLQSLSHSQIDFLISLRELAILRAKNAGSEEVAEKFDLRMLRALGTTLINHLRERIRNAAVFPESSEGFELLSSSQFAAKKDEKIHAK